MGEGFGGQMKSSIEPVQVGLKGFLRFYLPDDGRLHALRIHRYPAELHRLIQGFASEVTSEPLRAIWIVLSANLLEYPLPVIDLAIVAESEDICPISAYAAGEVFVEDCGLLGRLGRPLK
jgi:hypothetical protein